MPGCSHNLISFRRLIHDGYDVEYIPSENVFCATRENQCVVFAESASGLYTSNVEVRQTHAASPAVVTKQTQERAEKVLELEKSLGYPSDATLKRMLDGNIILDCPLTSKDVDQARSTKGVTNESYASKVTAPVANASRIHRKERAR